MMIKMGYKVTDGQWRDKKNFVVLIDLPTVEIATVTQSEPSLVEQSTDPSPAQSFESTRKRRMKMLA